jgi:hypothetical protein
MPLQLGGVETTRPQTITWDPSCPKQTEESERRYAALAAQGYRLRRPHPAGEMTLDPPPRGPDIGVFRVLSPAGDERYTWDRTNPDEVRDAFAKFKDYLGRGYTAYAATSAGKKGHKITEFDPALGEVIMVPKTLPG